MALYGFDVIRLYYIDSEPTITVVRVLYLAVDIGFLLDTEA